MVLLPLVHAAADAPCTRISIEAKGQVDRRAVVVQALCDDVPPGWSDEALHVVRETLLHYFGADASLAVSRSPAGAVATVSFVSRDTLPGVAKRVA
jgi:hypothetical protein